MCRVRRLTHNTTEIIYIHLDKSGIIKMDLLEQKEMSPSTARL